MRNAEATDFHSDVNMLLTKLYNDQLDGFVLDKWALAYVMLSGQEFLTEQQVLFRPHFVKNGKFIHQNSNLQWNFSQTYEKLKILEWKRFC